jgi:uncharacterized repeat protein (TIGR03803 family)
MSLRLFCIFAAAVSALTAHVGAQTFQPVYSLPADTLSGRRIASALTVGPNGALYGTAIEGGANGSGTAFKITTQGVFDLLGSFETATTGRLPYARLLNIGDGFLYGVTERNGNVAGDPAGTLYRLDPAGGATPAGGLSALFPLPGTGSDPKFPRALVSAAPNTIHVLGSSPGGLWEVPLAGAPPVSTGFSSAVIGAFPFNLIRGSDGFLYGGTEGVTTGGSGTNLRGTLYRVAPNGTELTRLHECELATGTNPYGAMVQATDGNFYGTMSAGGANSRGCIFRLSAAGYTVMHHLSELSNPRGDLMQAADGFLYGTAQAGGSAGLGGVFRIRPDGSGYSTLHVFSGADGASPQGGLVQAADGNLYGTTFAGGAGSNGTIYRIRLTTPPVDPNRAPVALGDVALLESGFVFVPVLENDFDPDDDLLTVTVTTPPTAGTAEVQSDGRILYTPGAAYDGSDLFTYTITDPEGKSASANVRITSVEPPPAVQPGVYNGIMNLDPELDGTGDLPRAQFIISVTAGGSFTGVVVAQRKRIPVSGFFLEDGTAIADVKFSKKQRSVMFLGFRADEPGSLLGILVGSELWLGNARPLRESASLVSERFTVLVESDDVTPAGYGYAVMRVLPSGLVVAAGRLGDGSRLSWGTSLVSAPDDTAQIPVFDEPVARGVCAGVLAAAPPAQAFAGALRWIRPAASKPGKPYALGFDGLATAAVSTFAPAATLEGLLDFGGDSSGSIAIGGGPLAAPAGGDFGISGKRTIISAPLRALSFNRKKGTFKGEVQVDRKTVKFNGVVNQQGNFGAGQLILGGETSAVVIQP